MITVSQEVADMSNGQQFRIQGAPDLLEPGKSYLFITRADPAEEYHVVVPGVGNLLLDVDDNAGRAAVLGSTDANSLRERRAGAPQLTESRRSFKPAERGNIPSLPG